MAMTMRQPKPSFESEEKTLDEIVVRINRCAAVVKGGRRFSFSALVVVGDRNGHVGVGYGKSVDVPSAVDKGRKNATRDMNAFVSRVDTVRAAFPGATVLVVHHSGKEPKRRDRGSTALRGGADTMMLLEQKQQKTLVLSCDKQKDAEEFPSFASLTLGSFLLPRPQGRVIRICFFHMSPAATRHP